MGKQGKSKFIGRRGNMVYYELNGQYYERRVPTEMPQSESTKKQATIFGKASQMGKAIRIALNDFMPDMNEAYLHNRLLSPLQEVFRSRIDSNGPPYQSLVNLRGFRFNTATSFLVRFRPELKFRWENKDELEINIPEMYPMDASVSAQIVAPARTTEIKMILVATCCTIDYFDICDASSVHIDIPYEFKLFEAKTIQLPLKTVDNSIVVIAGRLIYYSPGKKDNLLENKKPRWIPADIIEAVYVKDAN